MKRILPIALLCLVSVAYAQDRFLPLNHEWNTMYDEFLARKDVKFMTSTRPYRADELREYIPFDSLENDLATRYYPGWQKDHHSWFSRKLFSEHLVDVYDSASEFRVQVDPLFDFKVGRNQTTQPAGSLAPKTTFTNTRGFLVQGDVGRKFLFYSSFYENQSSFPYYIDNFIRSGGSRGVVPGQGMVKSFGNSVESFDYTLTIAGISYTLNKHFNFTFANDKNFIGDGYRSLLLSDNSFTYPFLRITADIWKIRYMTINAVMQDANLPNDHDAGLRKKYATYHYLLLGVGKTNRLSLGFFDAVMWATDTTYGRGFDLSYMNPVIFLKPLEATMNSPDNGLLGFTVRYKLFNSLTLYGQVMLDEFKLDEVKAGNGWWANKQAFQLGFKSFNTFGVEHLSLQSEVNYVRPYTYQHRSGGSNYAQYNQPLAHTLGANFLESVSFARYRYKRWFFEAELQGAVVGLDSGKVNYGGNVLRNYSDNGIPNYPNEYGNKVGQGVKTTLMHETLKVAWLLNPATNLRIELGVDNRTTSNDLGNTNALYVTFGIRTALNNIYYDF